jgi:NTP pyrophosphatase (non-canonical NTP hydrolase)
LVYGNARVYGHARVYGNARVYGDARVYGNARVSGHARVYGNAEVYGDAQLNMSAKSITHDLNELEKKVIRWASERKIIPNATPESQALKAVSEMGELADAVIKRQHDELVDAVGDVMVCLINLCALKDVSLGSCLDAAYNQIKDRKGTLLPNGCFVKEEAK